MELLENNFILEGGPVIYPLMFISVVGLVLFIERTLYLHKRQIGIQDFIGGIKNLVRKRRIVEALTLCEDTPGPMARIVKAALLHFGGSRETIRSAIQAAAIVEIPFLERRIGTIAAIARVAPLLGFLGTIVAAVQALYNLSAFNSSSEQLFRLLAQALITSAAGIAVSIMAILAHHFLAGRVRALVNDFERVGHDIHEFLLAADSENGGSTMADDSKSNDLLTFK